MSRSTLRLRSLEIGVVLAMATLAAASTPIAVDAKAAPRKAKANPPIVFAQTQSDLPVDPAARFGRLANGLTYVIYKNKTPPGAASVWMRVAAGSAMEQEKQRGLAHFIEHMAFNGSKNVPEGDMIKLLERDGLAFGADTNAQTQNFQTIYMLNLPDASQRIVGDALFLMRETAGNLTFDPRAIDRERGVILGEERARATVGFRAYEAALKQLFPGTKYPERLPIGKVDVVKTAPREAFLQFYNDFYRPEYTTLIVAGDIDPDRIEAEIRQRFSDWRPAPQSAAALTDFGKRAARSAPDAKIFTADGLIDMLSIAWVKPAQDGVETKARDFADLLFAVANTVLDERFGRAAKVPASAFMGAGLQRQDIQHTARTYALNIRPKDGQDKAAFDQAVAILRQYLANGPTRAELDRALLQYDRAYREGGAAARTIPTQAIAGLIVEALASQGVVQSPAQALAQWEAFKPAITPAAIGAILKPIMSGEPPILWRQGQQAGPFDEAALLAAWRVAMAQPVATLAAPHASVAWPYTRFGLPSAVVSRQVLADVGATRVTFANGTILTVKQTHFEDNAVHVAVQLGNGALGVKPDQGASLFMAKRVDPIDGGLGKMSGDDIREALAGKIYGLGFTIGNNAAVLGGATNTADLPVQMQVLAAFITDPGLRPDALDRVKAALPSAYNASRMSPDSVYALKAAGDPYSDDPRFTPPSQHDALAVTNDAVAALMRDQLGHGPIDVTLLGDITPDEAIKQVGATLGALPPMPAAVAAPGADRVRFPTNELRRIYTHDGRADQNLSVLAWPTTDYYADPRRATALELLAAVMTIRELDEVREKQSASYSASVSSIASRYFPGFGFIISRASVRPEIDETYYRTVSAIVADLKQRPVTPDELNRARLPLIDRLHNDKNGNAYWLAVLSGTIRDPRQMGMAEAREHDLLSITSEDLRKSATMYLDMSKALRIQVKPKDTVSK